jgi:hypothetical protein
MKISVCDNCRKAHPSEYLMLDTETGDYLCPTCYRNKMFKKERDNNSIAYFIIGALLCILFLLIK